MSVGSRLAIAVVYVRMSPVPTAIPSARRRAPNAASMRTYGSATGDPVDAAPDQLQVVTFLDDRAERVVDRTSVHCGLAQHVQGADPVDGLGHPGRLGQ